MRSLALVLGLALISPVFAQTDLPPDTIKCEAFKRQTDGNWRVDAPTTFDLGNLKAMTLSNQTISPRMYSFGGADLHGVLERKCGGQRL